MGSEYCVEFKNNKSVVKKYLESLDFPKDEHFKKTLIVTSEKGGVDCWLTWKGCVLRIESQVFEDQTSWCAAISRRLIDLFGCTRIGGDIGDWWDGQKKPHRPFYYSIRGLSRFMKKYKKEVVRYRKLQRLFTAKAKRILPEGFYQT